MLLAVVAIEAVRLAAVEWLSHAAPTWVLLPLLLALAVLAIRVAVGSKFEPIGFRPWREWSLTEKSYFVQVLVIANVVFPIVLATRLRAQWADPATLWTVFAPYLCYGFYQEVVYRGLLQTELVRRWGALAGILVANTLFTFGPLHWSYFDSQAAHAAPLFAATFAIGFYFSVLYRRSGNLWIVAVFHALGNAYLVAALGSGSSESNP